MSSSSGSSYGRGRVRLGLVLAATGGVGFGYAWASSDLAWRWVGALTFFSGLLLILSGYYTHVEPEKGPPRLLGELVSEKGWITDRQLADALVRHYHTKQPIGQILVGMGALSPAQLAAALREQGAPPEVGSREVPRGAEGK